MDPFVQRQLDTNPTLRRGYEMGRAASKAQTAPTVDPDACPHEMQSGVDTVDMADPAKVWRCHSCGKTGTTAELDPDRANVYAYTHQHPRPTRPRRRRELVIADLDRCPHRRHAHDDCFTCRDETHGEYRNMGNPHLDTVIGTALDGPFTVRDLLATQGRTDVDPR